MFMLVGQFHKNRRSTNEKIARRRDRNFIQMVRIFFS